MFVWPSSRRAYGSVDAQYIHHLVPRFPDIVEEFVEFCSSKSDDAHGRLMVPGTDQAEYPHLPWTRQSVHEAEYVFVLYYFKCDTHAAGRRFKQTGKGPEDVRFC